MRVFKGQMILFQRGRGYEGDQSHYVVAAWHWRWSITWSWLVWWWPKFKWVPSVSYYRRPDGTMRVGFACLLGTFAFSTQRSMKAR